MILLRWLISFFFIVIACCNLCAQDLHHQFKHLPCLNKNFNVYVHVAQDTAGETGITPEQIENVFKGASDFFAPICVSFTVCEIDTLENFNYDSLDLARESEEITSLFSRGNRINVFVLKSLSATNDATTCGFAPLNGISRPDNADIFIRKDCGAGTLAHELGHLFGLEHTFTGNGAENVNGDNCETAGDQICDTPADPYDPEKPISDYLNDDCEFTFLGRDAQGEFYQPDVGNIMSYYPCECGFTRGQYLKMVEAYENATFKLW